MGGGGCYCIELVRERSDYPVVFLPAYYAAVMYTHIRTYTTLDIHVCLYVYTCIQCVCLCVCVLICSPLFQNNPRPSHAFPVNANMPYHGHVITM